MEQKTVALERLVVDQANVRKQRTDDAFKGLKASIVAHGIIQPLAVRPPDPDDADLGGDRYRVYAGGRRLRAMLELLEEGAIKPDFPVPIIITEDGDTAAAEKSVAENLLRQDMVPVDEYRAFARLFDAGHSVADIALRFGQSDTFVRQRLSLGKLHPDILQAVENDDIRLNMARAFTLETDIDRQKEIFDRLTAGEIYGHQIKEVIVGNGVQATSGLAKFIGEEAYLAAGGQVTEDLFDNDRYWTDRDAVDKALEARKTAVMAEWMEQGWSFVVFDDDEEAQDTHPYSWKTVDPHREPLSEEDQARLDGLHEWLEACELNRWEMTDDERNEYDAKNEEFDRLEAKGWAYTDEDKARSGVFVSIRSGSVRTGVMRGTGNRSGTSSSTSTATEKPKRDPLQISAKAAQQLSVDLTKATQAALANDPDTALAVHCAVLQHKKESWYATPPLKIEVRAEGGATQLEVGYDTVLKRFLAMDRETLLERFAELTAELLDLTDMRFNAAGDSNAKLQNTRGMIVGSTKADVTASFDADAFFEGSTKDLINAAYKEMKPDSGGLTGKKAEIAALAAETARQTGWLPEPLRFDGYGGPGAKKKSAARKKPASKKKPTGAKMAA